MRDLTTRQVAEELKCTEEHVRLLCRKRQLECFRLGSSRYRVTRASLDKFRTNYVEPQPRLHKALAKAAKAKATEKESATAQASAGGKTWYPERLQRRAVELWQSGVSVPEVARRLGADESAMQAFLTRWARDSALQAKGTDKVTNPVKISTRAPSTAVSKTLSSRAALDECGFAGTRSKVDAGLVWAWSSGASLAQAAEALKLNVKSLHARVAQIRAGRVEPRPDELGHAELVEALRGGYRFATAHRPAQDEALARLERSLGELRVEVMRLHRTVEALQDAVDRVKKRKKL